MLIDLRLNTPPKTKHIQIHEREDLRTHYPPNALLPIRPPPQIRQPSPVHRILGPARGTAIAQHESQPPTLRCVPGDRIQLGNRVGQVWFRGGNALAAVVGEVWDLVREHLVDGFFLQDSGGCFRTGSVVEQDGDDFCRFISISSPVFRNIG